MCIVLIVNSKMGDDDTIQAACRQNLATAMEAVAAGNPCLVAIDATRLADKNAGVGLARKIGMDACIIASAAHANNPLLICLDGDCTVAVDYFQKIENQMAETSAEVCVLEFKHCPNSAEGAVLAKGIAQYECFLEYYRLGLYYAGYPFFYHTVGSTMGCKATVYAKSGGMNQRQAGEDFYFLHKLFPHYKTIEVNGPLVFPSSRTSQRVPFGTGRFQQIWLEKGEDKLKTYHPDVFSLLKIYLSCVFQLIESGGGIEEGFGRFELCHPEAVNFLNSISNHQNMRRIVQSARDAKSRRKAFFIWFDGLMALRFVHYFRTYYEDIPVEEGIRQLLNLMKINNMEKGLVETVRTLLHSKTEHSPPSVD